jgi:hypothetical protein
VYGLDLTRAELVALKSIIDKSRVHFYKPIQIAEILHKSRTNSNLVDFSNFDNIRKNSKSWRDEISLRLVGNKSTSSAKYQDDLFRAVSPENIRNLCVINNSTNGTVEQYIYSEMKKKWDVLLSILTYCQNATPEHFSLLGMEEMFDGDSGLKRSIDKMFEIAAYSILSYFIQLSRAEMVVKINPVAPLPSKVLEMLSPEGFRRPTISRVGVANAADRGIDMVTNFGPVVQVKHLPLSYDLVVDVCSSLPMSEVYLVINTDNLDVRKTLEMRAPSNLKGIITTKELDGWYSSILNNMELSNQTKYGLLESLTDGMILEFPHLGEFETFAEERGYSI